MDKYRIDEHKLYWHLDRLGQWQQDPLVAPIYVEVSPTTACNHRCIFCGVDFARNEGPSLETETACLRIEELGKLGVRSMMFAGEGEPLLHKGLPQMIESAVRNGIDVSITTNGSAGTPDIWRKILPQLTWLRFSIDAASPAVHAKIHQVGEAAFTKVTDTLRETVRLRNELKLKTTIGVQFLVLDENVSEVEDAINLYTEIGVDYLAFKPFSTHPQMEKKMTVDYNDYKESRVREIVERRKGQTKLNIIYRRLAIDASKAGEIRYSHCRALPFWGYISSKGDFYTCSVFLNDDRFKVGNIYQQTMPEIIFGERRKQSIALGQNDLCLEGECRLNCRMARINEFLEMLAEVPEHVNFI